MYSSAPQISKPEETKKKKKKKKQKEGVTEGEGDRHEGAGLQLETMATAAGPQAVPQMTETHEVLQVELMYTVNVKILAWG